MTLVVVSCGTCGQPFTTKPSRIAVGKGKFCSSACYHASKRHDVVTSICEGCGDEFQHTPRKGQPARRYCSYVCSVPVSNRTCERCGTAFSVKPSATKRFCSRRCALLSNPSRAPLTPEKFWSRVNRGADGECWEWAGTVTVGGYGYCGFRGSVTTAHRVAWEFAVGPIPAGLELDHLCRNRACCNPAHLEPVTSSENKRRARAAT